ncbi:MAG: YbhB/YbcL family Raf kinase inhibitor-like protein [Dehalococcoidia bacterium]|jgi:hypothetical protein|nr:YbhB/YbcL family Raf kinase inhibitor-like protein [Dehalococcoidia bacterium]
MSIRLFLALGIGIVAITCSGGDGGASSDPSPTPSRTGAAPADALPRSPEVSSPAFSEGETVPTRHTCDGEDLSPALSWSEATSATRSIALLMDDPDAPGGTFSHWLVFDMPPDAAGLGENVEPDSSGVTGKNDFGSRDYRGPCPPPGDPHRYRFTVFYLDRELGLDDNSELDGFLEAIEGHVLDQGRLTGTFGR